MKRHSFGTSFLILLALQMQARAELNVDVRYETIAPARDVAFSFNGESITTTTGHIQWVTVGGSHDLGHFQGFCLELRQSVPDGNVLYAVVDLANAGFPNDDLDGPGTFGPIGAAKAGLLSELWGRHIQSLKDSVTAAAFQIAVWETIYDGDRSLSQGAFQGVDVADPSVVLAQAWLDSLDGTGPMANLIGLTHPVFQDQVTEGPPQVMPEPTAVALLSLGAVGLLAYRWRRRTRTA